MHASTRTISSRSRTWARSAPPCRIIRRRFSMLSMTSQSRYCCRLASSRPSSRICRARPVSPLTAAICARLVWQSSTAAQSPSPSCASAARQCCWAPAALPCSTSRVPRSACQWARKRALRSADGSGRKFPRRCRQVSASPSRPLNSSALAQRYSRRGVLSSSCGGSCSHQPRKLPKCCSLVCQVLRRRPM
ncbi:hypothetical protein D3C81_1209660 [compost metagenome]